MRTVLVSFVSAAVVAAAAACGSGSGPNTPVSVAGCITQVDNNYMLVPAGSGAGGPVGTSGTAQKRYKLLDDTGVGVSRYVNREARITGRAGETTADGTTVLHVGQMTNGGECGEAK